MATKQRVKKIVQTKQKAVKKTLKATAYENPDRDDDLKEYLNRKDFHSFELELLMDEPMGIDESEQETNDEYFA